MTTAGRTEPVQAVLSAGNIDTSYLRAGAGTTVMLVMRDSPNDGSWSPLRDALFAALVTRCRVIMPLARRTAGGSSPTFSGWLHDFLEGLGAATICLVVADPFCQEAIEFVQEHSSQIERLVLLSDGERDLHVMAECPTCVLRSGSPSLVSDTTRFLMPDRHTDFAEPPLT